MDVAARAPATSRPETATAARAIVIVRLKRMEVNLLRSVKRVEEYSIVGVDRFDRVTECPATAAPVPEAGRMRRCPGCRPAASDRGDERRCRAASPVVRARGVTKRYRSTLAVDGLDVDIGHGITGLLGPNGAGKTTFISLVLGLRTRDAGELTVLGHDPATSGIDVRARIGFAPEHHNLPPDVHAADLVRHLGELHGLPRRAAIQRANDALWQVGLGEERFRPIGTMSTGQRQRVKLAGAIVHDPELVLLDEPTDGLDPLQRDDMLALIRRVGTEFGMDIVISSHHLEEAERICDAVVILGGGAVVRAGILSELAAATPSGSSSSSTTARPSSPRCSAPPASRSTSRARCSASLVADGVHDAVRDAVADLGVGIRRLAAERQTLEDVYMEASA